METFQGLIRELSKFWEKKGCVIHQPYDIEKGAGTLNPATFLRCLGPEPYKTGYVEPSRRPTDGRFGKNPNRVQHYFQFQVILKPSPPDIQTVYLESLKAVGLELSQHDIRFVHDDWENPTIGAAGLGWEAWIDGMEVTQITYFQVLGGLPVKPVSGELTYGLERLAMYLQDVDNIFDIKWNDDYTYGDIYHRNEVEWSHYNFEDADTSMWFDHFENYEKEAKKLIERKRPLPAYDFVMKASHSFNVLDARSAISVTERTGYITRIRNLAKGVAKSYIESREELGFPLLKSSLSSKTQSKSKPQIEGIHGLESKESEDFLLEIGSEELPATFVPIGIRNLANDVAQFLKKQSISYENIETYGTPRRLGLIISGLKTQKPSEFVEKKGPPLTKIYDDNGNLLPAGKGFFQSLSLTPVSLREIEEGKIDQLEIRNLKNVRYLFSKVQKKAESVASILQEELPNIILNLNFPKKMRWADLDISYARPLLWIVSLFGSTVVPFWVGNILSGKNTRGHRYISPDDIQLSHPKEYIKLLRESDVIVDIEERKKSIIDQLQEIEISVSGEAQEKEEVLKQVLYLVEKPFLTKAPFDSKFLKVPKELLVSEMVEHQKYFPLGKSSGDLLPAFVITANVPPNDHIRHGNQKVLSARLSDGVFLYEQDLHNTMEHLNEKLHLVTYQKDLGSVWEKVERIQRHCKTLHKHLPICPLNDVLRAAELCKADLASLTVFEFPELQGVMGKYFALHHGETKSVALAIEEHWMPIGEKAPLPKTTSGTLLSIADKLDNLVGCFSVGLFPSSSSDPYALRRQILGIIKMLIQGCHHLPLKNTINEFFDHFGHENKNNKDLALSKLMDFITLRVKTIFQDYGFSLDIIEASLSQGIDDIYDMFCRVEALHDFKGKQKEFSKLYEVYKRAKGQLQNHTDVTFNPKLLIENAEKELENELQKMQIALTQSINDKDYKQAYVLIANLQPPLAKLFEDVKILVDDEKIRLNRIALLKRVFNQFELLLDFSKIKEHID